MYLILALLFTIAFAVILHRSHRSKSMQALYGPQGYPKAKAKGELIYLTTLVAVLFALVGSTLYLTSAMNITPREDYTDPFGGTSACVPVTEPNGYDGTWLAPWLTPSTTAHQVGTTCWHTSPDAAKEG